MSRKLLALMISGMFAGGLATSALADDTPGTAKTPSAGTSSATSGKHDTSRASSGSGSIGPADDVTIRGSQTKAPTDTRGKSTSAGAPQTRGDGVITTRDDATYNSSQTKGSASSGSAAGSSTTAAGTINPNAASRDGVVTTRDENTINKSQTKGSASAPAGAGMSNSTANSGVSSTTGATAGAAGMPSGAYGSTSGSASGMNSSGMGGMAGMTGMAGQHSMQAKITSINPRTGKVSVRTDEGSLALHFPPEALADLKRGDTVTVHLGLNK